MRMLRPIVFVCILVLIVYSLWIGGTKETVKTAYTPSKWPSLHARTVILVSLDGFRNDYLDLGLTPHLEAVAREGVRAEYLEPSFPSLTFPNHYTLVTGLFPQSHGIVANDFVDPRTGRYFSYHNHKTRWNPQWWGGEPLWITAERQGLGAGVIMWPGSEVVMHPRSTSLPHQATYTVPYQHETTPMHKLDHLEEMLDLDDWKRPRFIAVYVGEVDNASHQFGPHAQETMTAIAVVDDFVGELVKELEIRNMTDAVDLVVVSDHGMASSSNHRLVYYDDIFSTDQLRLFGNTEAWPLLGIRPYEPEDTEELYNALLAAEVDATGTRRYTTYVRDTPTSSWGVPGARSMPEYYSYDRNPRIAPILAVPQEGYAFVTHEFDATTDTYSPHGIHGYDPRIPSMHAIFLSQGPHVKQHYGTSKRIKAFQNIEVYDIVCRMLGIGGAPTDGKMQGHLQVL